MTTSAELYACLYVKELPAQALLRLRPELRDKPCVVMEGEPPLQSVCSLNTRARLLGMTHPMTRVEVDTFPMSIMLPRSKKTEAATKAVLLECAGAFSPRVEDRSEDTAFLCGIDIAGTHSLFGPPEMLARSLLQRVKTLGIVGRVTISCNLHTSVCLVKGLSQNIPILVAVQGSEATELASLPLTVLDLTQRQAETFGLWGIQTIGMLAALPETDLIARMGQDGKRLRQLARGEMPHLFQPVEPPFTLEERIELDSPVEQMDSLLFGVNIMLEQLVLRAQARILALASVTITLSLDGGNTHARSVRPALPTNDRKLWLKLLQLDLEAHPPQASVLALTLTAEPGSTSKIQLGLFSPQLPEPSRLDVTLAHIRAIVGEENVGCAVLRDTHVVAEAFRVEPFSVPSGNASATTVSHVRTTMRQIRPPESVSVTLQDRRPAMFFFRQRRYTVEHAYGPWITSGDWWNQTLWGLEQWDLVARAQDSSLLCCCLMRDLMQNQWHMVAFYD